MRMRLSSFLQNQPNIFIYQRLGWKFAFYYTSLLGGLYFFFNRIERHKIKKSVYAVFAGLKSDSEKKSITWDVFRGIILHYYEKLFNAFSSAETLKGFFDIHMKRDDMTAIEQGLSKGNGVLLITGHFGGVEFIPGYLAAKNLPVTIIVRFSSNILRNISNQKAKDFSARIIDVDTTPNIMKSIIDNLKENRIVITQCDEIHAWRPSKRNRISFLGKDILLDRTMDTLAKRVDPSIVFGLMHRETDHRYKFITTSWEEIKKVYTRPAEIPLSSVALNFLEQYIYKYPREWYQWRQYADIETIPSFGIAVESPTSISLLKTSLHNVS
jgi:Kdo2-lipid IVA lauroyltransferase/acyltransferase